ncbi:hypothetical protein OS493_017814 [Desmophyllum pertusum]|uniref:Uncharacterized protein n=1 Tax=Desmophyllum pertusum TaxID=174260 RepID=A0A9X0CXM0_9CNID|nr:hypothetical protein OS493_017814 [Desmophyllum pertusum]
MVRQQCLACNNLMTESSRACVCGHVFEEASRFIGGKRFSEYRAKLYSKLETNRTRREARENKPQSTSSPQPVSNPKNRGLKQKRRSAEQSISDKRKRRKRFSRLQTNPSSALKQQPSRRNIVPPELSNRLPSALREINRRILVQNIMWLGLERE